MELNMNYLNMQMIPLLFLMDLPSLWEVQWQYLIIMLIYPA